MEQLTSQRSPCEARGRLTAIVAMVTCSVVLAACRSGGVTPGVVDPLHRRPPVDLNGWGSGRSTGVPEPTEAIFSAWIAAQQAFETAAHAPGPVEPDLAATTISPQIEWTESMLARMRTADEMAVGPVRFGAPEMAALSSRQATVSVCAHDAEIVVSARTDQPVEGIGGQVENERFISTMDQTGSGWKLANQVVREGACQP